MQCDDCALDPWFKMLNQHSFLKTCVPDCSVLFSLTEIANSLLNCFW
uniref:Uncharacterized protein n=1 Tax=Arundo donax TaxID=35708 RepID=A0A0A9D5B2_ARUDO